MSFDFFGRSSATIFIAFLFALTNTATAQTHTWTSMEHNTTALWSTGAFWDAGTAPGSSIGGAATDTVVVANTTGSNQTIRIQNVDVGTIDSLTIGGGTGRAALHVRGNDGNLDITNDLTIGVGGVGGAGGQLTLTNGEAAVSIGGNVISGSDIFDNRITIDHGSSTSTDGLVLVGDIDSAAARGGAAAFEIDFYVNRQERVTLSPNATFNVDAFFVGNQFANGTSNGSNDYDKTYPALDVDRQQLFRANEVAVGRTTSSDTTDRNNNMVAVLNIADAMVSTVDAGVGDRNIEVGFASSIAPAQMNAHGTINVNADGVLEFGRGAGVTTGSGQLFIGSMSSNITNVDSTAVGVVNVNSGGTVRGQYDGTGSSGRIVVGTGLRGDGTLNVNEGGVVSAQRGINIGGLSDTADDDGATGVMTINTGGVVDVSKVLRGGGNMEVGRGGTGTLNVNGGTLNLGWGNFVVGQSSQAEDLTADPPRPAIPNNSRGTVLFDQGAIVSIGDAADDGDPDGPMSSNFNINRGGGDITQTGAGTTVTIEGSLQMQNAVEAGGLDESTNPNSSYTIDNGTLDIGGSLNGRENLAGTNTFKVIGDASTVTVGGNAGFNQSSFTLELDFMGGNTITSIDIAGDANLGDATTGSTLTLSNTSGLATYASDIVLMDVTGSTNGAFVNAPADMVIGGYKLVYDYDAVSGSAGGGHSLALVDSTTTGFACDFDSDGDCDHADIDALYASSPTSADIVNWLNQASAPGNPYKEDTADTYVLGDANLDGDVNSEDLGLLLNNFNSSAGVTWDGGDLNADGLVNSADLGQLLNNFNHTSAATANAVPEPSSLALMLMSGLTIFLGNRRRR